MTKNLLCVNPPTDTYVKHTYTHTYVIETDNLCPLKYLKCNNRMHYEAVSLWKKNRHL